MSRVTSQWLEQFGWSACGSPRLNKEIGKKSKKQGRAEERVRKVRLKAVSQVSHLFQISTHLSSTWSFVDFHRINKSGLSIVFQSAPMVLNSHRERDNFQVHLCCKFTPNFANAGSMEIKIIRNRCWVYWQPKRRRRVLGFCRSEQQKWPAAVAGHFCCSDRQKPNTRLRRFGCQ